MDLTLGAFARANTPGSTGALSPGRTREADAVQRLRASVKSQSLPFNSEADHPETLGYTILDSLVFKGTIGVCVLLNTVMMGFEADYPELEQFWEMWENFFTAVFLAEAIFKIAVMRILYFQDRWNWIDFVLVVLSMLDMWVFASVFESNMQSLSILRIFRLFRLARVLRLIKRVQKLVLVIRAVAEALRGTVWVSSVMVLMIYICAVFCVGFLGHDKGSIYPGYSQDKEVIDATDLLQEFNPHISFGSIGSSMLTLFSIMILAEWSEVVRPVMLYQPYLVPFFVAFIAFATFGVMNVIVAMIVESVIVGAREAEEDELRANVLKKLGILDELKSLSARMLDETGNEDIDILALDRCINDESSGMKKMLSEVDLPRGFAAEEIMYLLDDNANGKLSQDELIEGFYRLIDSGSFQRLCLIQKGINRLRRVFVEDRDKMAAALDESRRSAEEQSSRIEGLLLTLVDSVNPGSAAAAVAAAVPSTSSASNSSRLGPTKIAVRDSDTSESREALAPPDIRRLAPTKATDCGPHSDETLDDLTLRLKQAQSNMESALQASVQQLCKVGVDAVHRAAAAEVEASSGKREERGGVGLQLPPAFMATHHTIEANAPDISSDSVMLVFHSQERSLESGCKEQKLITMEEHPLSTTDANKRCGFSC